MEREETSPSTLGRPGLRHGRRQLVGFLGLQGNPDVARGLGAGIDGLLNDWDCQDNRVDQNGETVADMLPGQLSDLPGPRFGIPYLQDQPFPDPRLYRL